MRTSIIILITIAVFCSAALLYVKVEQENTATNRTESGKSSCSGFMLDRSRMRVEEISNKMRGYSTITHDLSGLSTEGGVQINYIDNEGGIKLIQQLFYGETFKTEANHYFSEGAPIVISISRFDYEQPITINSKPVIIKVTKRDYYLSDDSKVCEWYLDGVQQQVDSSADTFVKSMIETATKQ